MALYDDMQRRVRVAHGDIQVPYAIGGSGSAYIYGFCDKYWRPDMSEADAKAFVVAALSHAISRDASSGGCIRTVVVDSEGPRRDFLPGDKVPTCFGEMGHVVPAGGGVGAAPAPGVAA
jgi:20S proteasome alpha/beta subunit